MQGHCSQLHLACEEKYTLHMIVAAASPCTVTSKQCIPSENETNFSIWKYSKIFSICRI